MSRAFMIKQAPFNPTQIGGCTLWLDGQDPAGTGISPTAGSTVTIWKDKSGNGNDATAYGTVTIDTLVNGKLAMSTTASSGFFGYFTNSTGTATTFVVATLTNGTPGYYRLFCASTGTDTDYHSPNSVLFACMISSGTQIGAFYNSLPPVPLCPGTVTLNQPFIITTLFTGTQCTINLTGTPTSASPTAQSTSFGYTYYGIGTHADNYGQLGETWAGTIAEVLHFPTALGTIQYQQVEASLAQTWGLRGELPKGHPGTTGIVYPQQALPLASHLPYIGNPYGISRPANLPIPSIALYPTPRSAITANLLFYLDAGNPASYPGSGVTWYDLAGSGLTTTLYNSPTYSSGNGGYLVFDPTALQYAQTSASLSTLTKWTIEVWHYYNGTYSGSLPCILTEVWSGTPINFLLGTLSGATAPELQTGFYGSGFSVTPSGYTLPATGWYQIVGTFDGSTITLYVNSISTRTNTTSEIPSSSGLGIRLMRRWDLGNYWGGYLAIVRIYNDALDQSQVAANYNSSKSRFGL